jgi:protein O-mannosyl-transferase
MRRQLIVIALLWLVILAVFGRVTQAEFVAWDDEAFVSSNIHIQGLDATRLHWMFTDVHYGMRYKPLSWLTAAIVYSVAGLKPFAFHAANLVLHCLNAALVYLVIRRLLVLAQRPRSTEDAALTLCAAIGALVWAVHPLRVEPVARVTDLSYCQALFFLLISLLCYLRANDGTQTGGRRAGFFWAAVGAFALSMLTYPFAFAFAVVLLALDAYPLRRFNQEQAGWRGPAARRILLEKVPFLLLGSLVLVTLFGRLRTTGNWVQFQPLPGQTLAGKAMQAAYIWAYYVWRPWLPLKLSPVYTTLVSFDPADLAFLASAALVIGTTLLLVWRRRYWPWALALWVCHLVLLIPALGLSEHPHYPGDRYSYIPGVLWSILLAAVLLRLTCRRAAFAGAMAGCLVLAAVLGAMSFTQARIWHDSETLFKYTLARLGDDPYRADIHWRLGGVYLRQRRLDEAVEQCRLTLALEPKLIAHFYLGQALQAQGHLDEALEQYQEVLRHQPDAEAHVATAGLFSQRGQVGEAIAQYRAAAKLQPDFWPALNNLAWILATCSDPAYRDGKEAVQLAEQACALTANQEPMVVGTLAAAYAEAGRFAEAAAKAEAAAALAEQVQDHTLAARNRQLLELYRTGQPYHDPAPRPPPAPVSPAS